jgi:hypothetical protein
LVPDSQDDPGAKKKFHWTNDIYVMEICRPKSRESGQDPENPEKYMSV